ncbi:antA/AntB antirepressor family protein [Corynebacterium propinquum]|uniref:antA/AntB antirepressor family protein n=1 Tax=Corynebacterium propinquum TaxID=43769 RepID=UPI00254FB4C7|nr:antA/AntB antirepressor family protein [Corynebacterium propinquum]MDK8665013.1 antA/AntB antirepressor family protein [Corynebacterium propinquum]
MTVATAELIPVHTNPDGGNVVMGRDLHEFLGIKAHYKDWFPRMVAYGFEEGKDFVLKIEHGQDKLGRSREVMNHIISLDMAKEISMIQRTERGKQARQYFIECERRLKQVQPELTPEQLMAKALPCSKPYLTIRLKPIIVVVSFYKDLNQASITPHNAVVWGFQI